MRLVKIAYSVHKGNAKKRGIEFNLTFDEWYGIWKPYYKNRGNKHGQLVMCRNMDKGAYEVGNVTIGSLSDNAKTRCLNKFDGVMKSRKEAWAGFVEETREDDEDGWIPKELKNPFRSSFV